MYRTIRVVLLFSCLPLMAFSCGQREELMIRPSNQITSQSSIEAIKFDYDQVKSELDAWASENGYSPSECYPASGEPSPLCKTYTHNVQNEPAVRLTFEYSPEFNMDKLSIECIGSGSEVSNACNAACEHVNSALTSRFGNGSVLEFRMNDSYGKDSGKMQLLKPTC